MPPAAYLGSEGGAGHMVVGELEVDDVVSGLSRGVPNGERPVLIVLELGERERGLGA